MRTLTPHRETLIYQKKHYLNQTLHHTVVVRPTSATDITITLPAAATAQTGTFFIVKLYRNGGTGNALIATNGAETIDGANNKTLSNNFDKLTLQTDGSEWFVITE